MMSAAGQYYRSSMRSVYNPAGMPGSGGQYSVMAGRHGQDPRTSSMFGSSINLNGEYKPVYRYLDIRA